MQCCKNLEIYIIVCDIGSQININQSLPWDMPSGTKVIYKPAIVLYVMNFFHLINVAIDFNLFQPPETSTTKETCIYFYWYYIHMPDV